ncbi:MULTISPECIES: YacL family protein [unclassified Oceanobacter]|uniref:YacL family protein n=1 Tax=unclassified Oceanobacter TaxID=2620260 RepID=UPI0026E19435|nr:MULTISPECIES: YacL family protein [unclassified Oceanobacter]MDO6681772.1 YacL family protein [Oceanobacter sp. 5_MG-2023]MDP2506217.1 YacL family protein [Oceanobacter sp. 3_MG-2023]MDP2546521.1 YacL family protein [Oceanobacter sp. 4_MG-2023]MDP2609691.1 YacL family protein [Oceanobacter sp. 1_MG-2023]MDP2613844.1 YacL family protein [Oceanobacter sp. 2_MG-2023]
MDYEFWFEGNKPVARLDEEHSLLSHWLTDEIGDDLKHLRALITTAELLQSGGLRDYRWQGKETILKMTQHEVDLASNTLLYDEDLDLEEDLILHDYDLTTGCGLEDFIELLQAWKEFIAS